MANPRIGIVGGGLGGLAAACVLAARGHAVVLFERGAWLGGKAAVLEAEGFRFDMGPTILTLPSVLRRIFADPAAQSQDQAVSILVEQLFAEPNYDSLVGQLDSVRIEQAHVTLRDVKTGLAWVAPDARAELGISEGFVRFSAGLEHPDYLIEDLTAALGKA